MILKTAVSTTVGALVGYGYYLFSEQFPRVCVDCASAEMPIIGGAITGAAIMLFSGK